MKEIKFKAFHKADKKIYEVYGFSKDKWFLKGKSVPMPAGAIEIMQFTGLHDKNGQEIYDGYIVHISDTTRILGKKHSCNSKVKNIDGHPYVWPHPVIDGKIRRFGARLLMSGSPNRARDHTVVTDEVIVIGNMYENPELLEVK